MIGRGTDRGKSNGSAVLGRRGGRRARKHPFKMLYRFVEAAELLQYDRKAGARLDRVGLERHRAMKVDGRFGELSLRRENHAAVMVRLGPARLEGQRPAEKVGCIAATRLMRDHAEQMKGASVARIGSAGETIETLGVAEVAGAMVLHRDRRQLRGLAFDVHSVFRTRLATPQHRRPSSAAGADQSKERKRHARRRSFHASRKIADRRRFLSIGARPGLFRKSHACYLGVEPMLRARSPPSVLRPSITGFR